MAVPEDLRLQVARWCAARIPAAERTQRRITYSVHGDEVTVVERRAPTYPELDLEWTTTPLARLRYRGPGAWSLHRPVDGRWQHDRDGDDPVALLEAAT